MGHRVTHPRLPELKWQAPLPGSQAILGGRVFVQDKKRQAHRSPTRRNHTALLASTWTGPISMRLHSFTAPLGSPPPPGQTVRDRDRDRDHCTTPLLRRGPLCVALPVGFRQGGVAQTQVPCTVRCALYWGLLSWSLLFDFFLSLCYCQVTSLTPSSHYFRERRKREERPPHSIAPPSTKYPPPALPTVLPCGVSGLEPRASHRLRCASCQANCARPPGLGCYKQEEETVN